MSKFAWVTLATNDSYSLGALVVAASLKRAATVHQTAVLITPGVTAAMRAKLATVFDVVQEVNVLDSKDSANLALLARPELGVTFTKLHCWNLTQFDKCVFLDADTLVLQNCDELFEREELSAAPDVGWPDCFNSGVFVFRPSQDTFGKLLDFAVKAGSFDGGDQGLLNLYFADWAHSDISKHLPFVYNTCSTATYSYLPAFKQFGRDVKILHFIGSAKPWLQNFDPQTRSVRTPDNYSHLACHLQTWWAIFFDQIHPQLTTDMPPQVFGMSSIETGIAGALASVTLGESRTPEQEALESQMRRQCWESGNIDYMGRDSFDNILKRINLTMGETQETQTEDKTEEAEVTETVVAVTEEKLAPGEIVRSREDGAEERIITTVGEDGKITQKVITTFPKHEVEEEVVTEEITEGDNVTVTTTTTVTTNVTQSEIVGVPKVAAPTVTTATSTNPTPTLELTKKPEEGKELVEYDEATKTTTLTRRIEKGYEQVLTTVMEDGTKRIQTRTFMDPEEVVDESEEVVEDESRTIKKETNITKETRKVATDQQAVEQTTKTVETQKKEIVEEEFVVTEAMNKLKTGEEITKVDETTKTTTVVKRIENGFERTTTRVFEDGTSKSSTKTIFDTVEIKDEQAKAPVPDTKPTTVDETTKKTTEVTQVQTQDTEEFVITEEMKKLTTGQEIVKKDKKTNTTTVIKRIENGYEKTVTVVFNDGSMRSQTKIIYDPVEVVEETKQVTPIVPATGPLPVTTKTTETTTDSTKTVESTKQTKVQEQQVTQVTVDEEAMRKRKEEITKIETQEIVITEAMKKLKVGEEIVEVIERISVTIITKRIEKGYERVTNSVLIDGTRRTHKKTTFDPVPVPPPAPAPQAPEGQKPQETPKAPEAPKAPELPKPQETPKAPEAPAPTQALKPQEAPKSQTTAVDTTTTQQQQTSTTTVQETSKKVSTQETVQKQQNVQQTTTTSKTPNPKPQETRTKVETTVKSYETEEEFVPTEAMKKLKVGEELTEVDEVTKTIVVTKRTEDGYEQTITTVLGDGTKKTYMKTFYDSEEVIEETEEYEDAEETTKTKTTKETKKEPSLPDPTKVLAVCPTRQEVSIINDPNIAMKRVVRHGEEEIQMEEEEEDENDPTQKTKRAIQETRKAKVALEESQKTEGATQTLTTTASADAQEKKSEVISSNVGGINADVRTTSESTQSTKTTTSTSVTPSQGPGQGSVTVTTMKTEKSSQRKQSSSAVASTTGLEALTAPQPPPRKKETKKGKK